MTESDIRQVRVRSVELALELMRNHRDTDNVDQLIEAADKIEGYICAGKRGWDA